MYKQGNRFTTLRHFNKLRRFCRLRHFITLRCFGLTDFTTLHGIFNFSFLARLEGFVDLDILQNIPSEAKMLKSTKSFKFTKMYKSTKSSKRAKKPMFEVKQNL